MSDTLYVTSTEARAGKAVVTLGVLELLARRVDRLAVFRPVIPDDAGHDPLLDLLRTRFALEQPYADTYACTYEQAAALADGPDPARLVAHVVERHARLRERYSFVLCVGTDFTGPATATELDLNATFAANVGAPVLPVVSGRNRSPEAVRRAAESARRILTAHGCALVATVVNRVDRDSVEPVRAALGHLPGGAPVYVLADLPVLSALTVEEVAAALGTTARSSSEAALHREVDGYVIGSGLVPTVLGMLREGSLLVASGDRADLAVLAAAAAASPDLPTPGGVLLTCGQEPDARVLALLDASPVPVVTTGPDTYATLHALEQLTGQIRPTSRRKIAAATGLFSAAVDGAELAARIAMTRTDVVTPVMFSFDLLERARADRRRIVLPEGEEERILRAAEEVVHLGVADLTLLGDTGTVRARIDQLGLDLAGTQVLDPATSPLRERFATEYARLRGSRAPTPEAAADAVTDPSYFATMCVHCGLVDGMVSGAVTTTAATIRPALEILRTGPDASLVSSAFFLCLPTRVLVFADCAVVPDPTAEELADIAVSTAETATAFGIEPRVAMLSYATGASGRGADVDKVRAATRLVAVRRPDLPLTGPIQYDAAVDPGVAAAKLPGDPVAGRATVLVFPDLNAGNNTYKAVQRSSGAIAIGPVLQGLARPVNDLSRGATVADIVNTVAVTAIQAGRRAGGPPGRRPEWRSGDSDVGDIRSW